MPGGKIFEGLIIDPEKVSEIIADFLRKKVKELKKDGIALGLSGGLDSSTVAILAAKAVGPSNVYTLYLPERNSEKKFGNYAQKVAEQTGINLETISIDEIMEKGGVYEPFIMKIIPFSKMINKLIVLMSKISYPLIFGESPFVVTLKQCGKTANKFGKKIYDLLAGTIETSYNARHIERRKIMEKYSEDKNLLLVGAANKSEAFVGWFVKNGIDDLPIETIGNLYKTQVRQLAKYLKVPEEILGELPSPDMFKGVDDEKVIGYSYAKIDVVAYVIEHGLEPEIAFANGITPKEFENIKNINRFSAWKRENPHESPEIE